MPKVNKAVHIHVALDRDEIRAILVTWFSTQRAGCVVVPTKAVFDLSDQGATFTWDEGDNG